MLKVLSLVSFVFCSSFAFAGNGVIVGTGASITDLMPVNEVPHHARLRAFFDRLAPYEPTLTRLMRDFYNPNDPADPKIVPFKRTEQRCAEERSPNEEVRAVLTDGAAHMVILCKAYHDLSEDGQVATILHELIHYTLRYIPHHLGGGEEPWVAASLEKELLVPMLTAEEPAFAAYAKQLGILFDRNVPNLYLFAAAQEVLNAPMGFPMFEQERISFVMPQNFLQSDFRAPHFLGEFLSLLWHQSPDYGAQFLFALSASSPTFHKIGYLTIKRDPIRETIYVERVSSTIESERVIPLARTTAVFQMFFSKYTQVTGRAWITDGKYFYFFE